MSGIYVHGMEMPKSCYGCPFFSQYDYWNENDEADILSHCKRTGEKTWDSVNGYLPNCPLVPVPDHGRLIDADALIEKDNKDYEIAIEASMSVTTKRMIMRIHEQMQAVISDAPTIIPADHFAEVGNMADKEDE